MCSHCPSMSYAHGRIVSRVDEGLHPEHSHCALCLQRLWCASDVSGDFGGVALGLPSAIQRLPLWFQFAPRLAARGTARSHRKAHLRRQPTPRSRRRPAHGDRAPHVHKADAREGSLSMRRARLSRTLDSLTHRAWLVNTWCRYTFITHTYPSMNRYE